MSPERHPNRRTRPVPTEPQGPQRDVPDSFRSAVLNTPALNGLMSVRPEAAKEVLLAVSIQGPREISRQTDMGRMLGEELGLSDWPDGSPAMPWKGSFLRFLEISPEQGLDAIVQLVNYATSKWLEQGIGPDPTEERRRDYSLAFEVAGKTILWTGDGNVFGWNRSFISKAAQVECALMALEQWLDNEIEAGRGIERWVQYLFDQGQSIAFAGVLVSVGLKHPVLFAKALQPLLGNFYLYDCQREVAASEQQEVWAISLFRQSPEVIDLAVKWHRQRHRRCLLRDIAVWLMHQDVGTRAYLAERKAVWEKEVRAEGKAKVDLEFFLARFDPGNYTETPTEDGCVEITMKWPSHLQLIADQTLSETRLKMLAMGLAMRARRLLDGQEVLLEAQLPEFVSQLRQLAEWRFPAAEPSQDHYRISSIAGALAVLLVQHRPWLKKDSDLEKWVLDTLRALDPVLPEHHSPRASTDHTAESFLGEAGVALLLESKEEWVYRLAFEGVTAAAHNATLHTMWRAYQLREQLGETFVELVNVVVLWSALRRAGTREVGPYAAMAVLAKQKPALFARLVGGRLKTRIPLSAAERLGRGLVERIERRVMRPGQREWQRLRKEQRANDEHEVDRDMPDLDLEVLHAGFAFLEAAFTGPAPAPSILSDLLNELFDLEMRTLPALNPEKGYREVRGTPYDFDNWVMRLVAAYIAHTNSLEIAGRFYRPVLDLGPAARYWVDEFLGAWVTIGLPRSPDRPGYVQIWKEMIDYVRSLPSWQPGKVGYWCPAEILGPYLVGIHEAPVVVLGEGQYRPVVAAMATTFEDWGSRWLGYPSIAQWYANFLTTDSGEVLLAQGIRQMATAMNSFDEEGWKRYDLGTLLTETLSLAWTKLRKEIDSVARLREAFLKILAALCARQVPQALNLRNKVTEALSMSS